MRFSILLQLFCYYGMQSKRVKEKKAPWHNSIHIKFSEGMFIKLHFSLSLAFKLIEETKQPKTYNKNSKKREKKKNLDENF